jgi:hypothetical protein
MMRGKDLYEKITGLDNDIISENFDERKAKKRMYLQLFAAAACFAIIISVVFILHQDKVEITPDLPMLTLDTDFSGAMGFEGYMAWSIADLTNANPWNEDMNLTHLPVIENQLIFNQMEQDFNLMKRLLKEAAQNLGMNVENLPITNDAPDEETKKAITEKHSAVGGKVPEGCFDISRLFMEDEKYKVEVDTKYTVRVDFKTPIKLPEEYNFTHYATYDETYAVQKFKRRICGFYRNEKS